MRKYTVDGFPHPYLQPQKCIAASSSTHPDFLSEARATEHLGLSGQGLSVVRDGAEVGPQQRVDHRTLPAARATHYHQATLRFLQLGDVSCRKCKMMCD